MSQESRNRYRLLVIVMVGIVAGYAYHRDFASLYTKYCESRANVQQLRESVRRAQALEEELARKVDRLGHDVVEMEAAIRRNKELVREGETIYRVELPPDLDTGGATRSQ